MGKKSSGGTRDIDFQLRIWNIFGGRGGRVWPVVVSPAKAVVHTGTKCQNMMLLCSAPSNQFGPGEEREGIAASHGSVAATAAPLVEECLEVDVFIGGCGNREIITLSRCEN